MAVGDYGGLDLVDEIVEAPDDPALLPAYGQVLVVFWLAAKLGAEDALQRLARFFHKNNNSPMTIELISEANDLVGGLLS